VRKQNATFIENDLEILRRHYEVEDFHYTPGKTLQLFKKIKECDLVYVWFISYPAWLVGLINKLYRKPIVLIAGGYGVSSDILKRHRIFKLMVKSAIKNSSEILAVSKFTAEEVHKLAQTIFSIKKYILFHDHIKIIYNSIDLTKFSDHGIRDNKKPMMLTVGIIDSWKRYWLKGIDKFIAHAKNTPNAEFYVVGVSEKMGKKIIKSDKNLPKNLHLYLPVDQQGLVYFYNNANIYCQYSRHESFCMTLLEALACGCLVLFTEGTGMDEVFTHRNNLKIFDTKNREKKLMETLNGYRN
jgi:glycosyltransferase involved in cell wall biosynthesis